MTAQLHGRDTTRPQNLFELRHPLKQARLRPQQPPNTRRIKAEITLFRQHPVFQTQTPAKEELESMPHKRFSPPLFCCLALASSVGQKEVVCQADPSACLRHGRPTLLTSDAVGCCCDELEFTLTSAPGSSKLVNSRQAKAKNHSGGLDKGGVWTGIGGWFKWPPAAVVPVLSSYCQLIMVQSSQRARGVACHQVVGCRGFRRCRSFD